MIEISASVLDVDEENSVQTFYNLETAKPDYFHIDVMDGIFVENNTLKKMRDFALKVHTITMTQMDVHLMVKDPMSVIDYFIDQGADRITFHIEACEDREKVFEIIKYLNENGVKSGIAVSPDTDVEKVYEFLPYVHMILIMSVVPGKGGQKFIETSLDKIRKLRKYCDENNYEIDIEVDGGINDITAKKVIEAGATILVPGRFLISSDNYKETIKKLRNLE